MEDGALFGGLGILLKEFGNIQQLLLSWPGHLPSGLGGLQQLGLELGLGAGLEDFLGLNLDIDQGGSSRLLVRGPSLAESWKARSGGRAARSGGLFKSSQGACTAKVESVFGQSSILHVTWSGAPLSPFWACMPWGLEDEQGASSKAVFPGRPPALGRKMAPWKRQG